ncbi:hypothetical protein L2E82_03532 [Cichorium intybus]|uniref:Uncharacterized protein n=1 Tax=Cichorium intybus TaxID=13427 RepID=A0ACB9H410_CICIN|nr:hypothetical protein L2E82_03532 [Cichorium intybus]
MKCHLDPVQTIRPIGPLIYSYVILSIWILATFRYYLFSREIRSKYINKLEKLKYQENSKMAVQCVSDMVTNALIHIEDCLKYMSELHDHAIIRFCSIPQIMAI